MRFELGNTTISNSNNNEIDNSNNNEKKKTDRKSPPPIEVVFPFERLHREQYDFMVCVKESLDKGGHCLLEMPAASGSTECLLSLILSLPLERKLVYAINPLPKMKRALEQIEMVQAEIMKVQSNTEDNGSNVKSEQDLEMKPLLAICLSSNDQELLDASYRETSKERNSNNRFCGCDHQCNNPSALYGIYPNLEILLDKNKQKWCCSNHLIQYAITHARVLVVQYQYLLDAKVSRLISSALLQKRVEKDGDVKMEDVTSATPPINGKKSQNSKDENGEENSSNDAIIAFDQAHNIDSVCLATLSVALNSNCLDQATLSLRTLSKMIDRLKDAKQQQLHQNGNVVSSMDIDSGGIAGYYNNRNNIACLDEEYRSLVNAPIDSGIFNLNKDTCIHSNDLADWEPVPGNLRRAEHFIGFLRKIIEYYKAQLRGITTSIEKANKSKNNNGQKKKRDKDNDQDKNAASSNSDHVQNETPLAFMHRMTNKTGLEAKALQFTYTRLTSLLRTLKLSNYPLLGSGGAQSFSKLLSVAELTSIFATYADENPARFVILTELNHPSAVYNFNNNSQSQNDEIDHSKYLIGEKIPTLQLACLDASVALAPLLERFRTVILTGTSLSPIHFYKKLLCLEKKNEPRVMRSFEMSSLRPCVFPMVISRGSDQLAMSTKYSDRASLSVVRNYGSMLVELCSAIPDGVVAYFTSYSYMESLIQEWDAMGIMRELTKSKLVFIETLGDLAQTTVTLDNYRLACDTGRGGVFLATARGKVAESIAFDSHYGRATIMFGLPFPYTLSNVLRARVEYGKVNLDIREQDYLTFDAIRQTSKCLANTLRSKMTDYSILILADMRFNQNDKRSKLPSWILQFLPDYQLNLSTENAIAMITKFLRHMSQPVAQDALRNILLSKEDLDILIHNKETSMLPEIIPSEQLPN